MNKMEKLIITPKTKIYDLLEAYPELEKVLIEMAPQFEKLKNPILRKTIARVTNLSQAAIIGNLNVENLVNKLRSEIGQNNLQALSEEQNNFVTEKPEWFDEKQIINKIDIKDMLNAGEQPVHEVMSAIKKLNDKQILMVVAPFVPAPLIDKSLSLNYKHWIDKKSEEDISIYFTI